MNNNCSSNAGNAGIWIEDSSSGNIILNNTCTDNGGTGISLLDSSGNSVGRNTCNSNGRGLGGENLTGNSIHNNTCSNNLNDGIWTWYSSDNGIFNNVCNANGLNGTTLMYARNSSVINNHCTGNAYSGITVDSSDNNKFTDNNCSSNDYGIFCASYTFHGSSINDVSNNSFFNNVYQGIKIINSQSQKNRIWNNTFHHNNGAGDTYDPAHIQAYDKANNHWNSSISGCGNYWSDWQTPDDVPPGYIVDNPYNIDGSGGAKDYFPRIRFAISELGPLSVMITAPTSNPDISTGWHMIYLRGNASDDVKVTSVTWSNSLGGSGVAYMTPQLGAANVSWQSRGNVMLYDGVNVITVTAYDNEGDSTTDTLNVTYNTGPSVTITAPTSNPTMMTGWHMINLRGTASDDFKVVSVSWTNSLGGSGVAYCTPQGGPSVNWQSRGNVMLYSGGNVITVTAYDNTGKTATDVLTMTYTGP
jgi:parallel beta-helix repeat protein